MPRGSRDLTNNEYDTYLASKDTRGARQEIAQRHSERRNAHDSEGRGHHFGLGNDVVRVEGREHLRHELDKRGLMLEVDVKKNLRGPRPHEFKGKR